MAVVDDDDVAEAFSSYETDQPLHRVHSMTQTHLLQLNCSRARKVLENQGVKEVVLDFGQNPGATRLSPEFLIDAVRGARIMVTQVDVLPYSFAQRSPVREPTCKSSRTAGQMAVRASA